MKLGNVRVMGDLQAGVYQRVYTKHVTVADDFARDGYDVLDSHFDGADHAVAYTDPIAGAATFVGTAKLEVDAFKFGVSSLFLDGNSDSVYWATSASWKLGSGNFTIDCWARFANPVKEGAFATVWAGIDNREFIFEFYPNALYFTYSTGGTGGTSLSVAWTPAHSTWYHIAVVRSGNNLYFFVDGTQVGATQDITGITLFDSTSQLEVGSWSSGTGDCFSGWLDEVRISKGVARWTSNFTPPTLPYGVTSLIISGVRGNELVNGNFGSWPAGSAAAPGSWISGAESGIALSRETSIVKLGKSALKITRAGTDCSVYQSIFAARGIDYWKGKTVTFGVWVYATVADRGKFLIYDGVGGTNSGLHTGDSTWQWITATRTISSSATTFWTGLYVVTGDTSVYFADAVLVEGSSIPFIPSKPTDYWLAGDTDEEYVLRCRFVSGYAGTANAWVLINNDSGANYGCQQLGASNTDPAAWGGTRAFINDVGLGTAVGAIGAFNSIILSKSGCIRNVLNRRLDNVVTTTVSYVLLQGFSWNNIVDEVTSFVVLSDQNGGIGAGSVIELFRKVSKGTT